MLDGGPFIYFYPGHPFFMVTLRVNKVDFFFRMFFFLWRMSERGLKDESQGEDVGKQKLGTRNMRMRIEPPRSLTAKAPEGLDGWKTFSFPFGAFRPIFRGKLAVKLQVGMILT